MSYFSRLFLAGTNLVLPLFAQKDGIPYNQNFDYIGLIFFSMHSGIGFSTKCESNVALEFVPQKVSLKPV